MSKNLRHTKIAMMITLVIAMLVALWLLMYTDQGQAIMQDPGMLRGDVQAWVVRHPFVAPIAYIAIYVLMVVLMMPVWWLQVLAGYAFGVTMGITWSALAAALSAGLTVQFSHFLVGDYFEEQVGSRLTKVHDVMEKLGDNGFLTVLAVRALQIVPFGLSSYVFGLTKIKPIEAALGALIGGTPSTAAYVAAGSPIRSYWQFWAILIGINVALILPFILHWRRHHRASEAPASV